MNKFSLIVIVAIIAGLFCAPAAFGQNTIAVVAGDGQLLCQACNSFFGSSIPGNFQPLVVRVTNASGAPVSGTTVTWTVTTYPLTNLVGSFSDSGGTSTTSVTDANGYAKAVFVAGPPSSGTAQPAPVGDGTFISFLTAQTGITASTTDGASAIFALVQGLQDPLKTGPPINVQARPDGLPTVPGSQITGEVGTTNSTPIRVAVVAADGIPLKNISVTLVNAQTGGPTVACQGSNSTGVGTVLTDASGVGTCYPVFGGKPQGVGQYTVLVGGSVPACQFVASSSCDTTVVAGYWPFANLRVSVTGGVPGSLRIITGNGQTAAAGQSLSSNLVVEADSTSGAALSGQQVNWRVTPTGAASLGSSQSTTDASGRASNSVVFASNASGVVQITATLASDTSKTTTFNVTAVPNVTITGLTILSGNNQTAVVNSGFGLPLVVLVSSSAGVGASVPVQFSVSGPAFVSSNSVVTNANGQASVNVTAGSSSGTATVTASAGGFSQSFTLTVTPPPPPFTAANFYNGADLQRGSLSPCSLGALVGAGVATGIQNTIMNTDFGPYPLALANNTVSVGGISAPIVSVGVNSAGQQQMIFQVPCEVVAGASVPVVLNLNGSGLTVNIPILAASPGILQSLLPDANGKQSLVPSLIRPDGTFVTASNPARRGESLVALVTGLGPTNPSVSTNSVSAPGAVAVPLYQVIAGMSGSGITPSLVQLSPDRIGVYLVSFTVPAGAAQGNVNFSISVIPTGSGSPISSGTVSVPVQ